MRQTIHASHCYWSEYGDSVLQELIVITSRRGILREVNRENPHIPLIPFHARSEHGASIPANSRLTDAVKGGVGTACRRASPDSLGMPVGLPT